MTRVLISGDRKATASEWNEVLDAAICELPYLSIVIHGAARGIDRLAAAIAEDYGYTVIAYPYLGGLGRAGGPARNLQMLREGKPDEVWLFHNNLFDGSKGTLDMGKQAFSNGLPVSLMDSQGRKVQLRHEDFTTAWPLRHQL